MSTELEDRLREEIRHATAGVRVPPGLAEKAWRRRRRRIAGRVVAAGTAAAAAGAIVAVGTTGASPPVRAFTTAYVVRHVEAALDAAAAADDIVYQRITGGSREIWTYRGPSGLLSRNAVFWHGQLVIDSGQVVTPAGGTAINVIYSTRTWYTAKIPAGSPLLRVMPYNPSPQTSCRARMSLDFNQPVQVLTANIRRALACGQLTDEGTQHVDGVAAIKLVSVRTQRLRVPIEPAASLHLRRRMVTETLTETMVLWVDPATYLPVRTAFGVTSAAPLPMLIPLGSADIRWLAPTRANLALLTVPIPPGFRHVPTPP
jgi:hypothetical protein